MKRACPAVPLVLILIAAALSATAQTPTNPWFYQPLAQVKEFLQLSDAQVQSILASNEEYNRWSVEKQARAGQVQGEIAEETAREVLNPMALGVRYAEVETICRELKARAAVSLRKNVDSLTAPQKAKLQVLQDAIKLAPVISEAQSGNLLAISGFFPQFFLGNGFGSGTITSVLTRDGGCYFPPFPQFGLVPTPATARATR